MEYENAILKTLDDFKIFSKVQKEKRYRRAKKEIKLSTEELKKRLDTIRDSGKKFRLKIREFVKQDFKSISAKTENDLAHLKDASQLCERARILETRADFGAKYQNLLNLFKKKFDEAEKKNRSEWKQLNNIFDEKLKGVRKSSLALTMDTEADKRLRLVLQSISL